MFTSREAAQGQILSTALENLNITYPQSMPQSSPVQRRAEPAMAANDIPSPSETAPLLGGSTSAPLKSKGSFAAEGRLLLRYSVPLIATYLLQTQYSSTVITTVVAGRLGADSLAAASIGLTTMNIIGLAFYEGMATALDTLCAQSYGSGRLTEVGLHIQRMTLLMIALMIPVGAFWLCSPSILPLLVRQHDVAVKAGTFLQISLIGLPGYALFEAGKRFLQAQGDFRSGMVVLVICTPVNVVLCWLLAIKLDMGVEGAALGQAIANDLRPLLLLAYTFFFHKWSHVCWNGWSMASLRGWGPMVRLSAAGTAVNLAEWLAFEILMISTSYIDTNHLAAQTILTTVSIVMWHIPFSVSVAVTTRVGHLIGAGQVDVTRRAVTLYAVVFLALGLFDGLLLFLLRDQIGAWFSEDDVVQRIATRSMLFVAVFQVIDALLAGCNGVLRGLARQHVAAWIVLLVNYLGAVPLSMWLELGSPDLKLDGLWIGTGCGTALIALLECLYMRHIRWQDCVEDVKKQEDL
ncbi:hypothetical protein D7B24_006015 [Verticillium nonalfalfae]|uniref:Uncharacterized protein n=1 Tax=Verticillium nonalfalfae TaxID=1051616 RepID=A0A3M9YJU6_9PEZI|nr:uncharacterized protein D7B24_006015 [Verticillium nonalfalfae]RNJ60863.1 hypothetical protein D7B24_006015 [Verticillium nonalfalfae]